MSDGLVVRSRGAPMTPLKCILDRYALGTALDTGCAIGAISRCGRASPPRRIRPWNLPLDVTGRRTLQEGRADYAREPFAHTCTSIRKSVGRRACRVNTSVGA
jgi:hypothetical protein